MSRIQELIEKYCGDGVKWEKIESLIEIYTGEQFNKRDMLESGKYPVLNGGIDISGYVDVYNEDENTITISQGGASAGYVNFMKCRFWAGAHCFVVRSLDITVLNNRYLYYFIKESEYYLMQSQYGAGIPSLSRDKVKTLNIPFPPIEVQEEIVRILDNMENLTLKLQEELDERKRQYEYYREELLSYTQGDKSVEWLPLGCDKIGEFHNGRGILKSDFVDEGLPCIHYGQIHTTYGFCADKTISYISEEQYKRSSLAEYGDLIIATTSEDVEACCKSVVWLGKEKVAVSGDACFYRHKQNPKYMGYLFQTNKFLEYKRLVASGAKVVRVHRDKIAQFIFPIPSLEKQEEVVGILDNMRILQEKLQEEIDLRTEQYEYYREQLLTFKRKAV